ncbi:hypothetical protein QRD40_10660 [Comamonas sp. Y6]|uniref:DUF669 domain-containing protein n=1 Tax=Comamonas resistens TaxID=3046670 RepID=A0ABY8SVR9_9BURK|nr:hypothetical protein [Comamonas resistens]MDL5036807.1 hypothetical protein [Comamonas resistens]WHS67117.1 hypothetical protein QMY55_08375 [Comamonas resistens]
MYQLNANAAREAENISSYLSETGKYKGKFIRAEKLISSNKGTHGVGFTFESDSKQTTRFDIWTMSAQNEQLMGYKAINAIMACMKLKTLSIARAEVERTDWDTKQKYKEEADIFPELLDKPIGLVLVNTEYEKMRDGQKTGETGWRLELVAPFEAATEFTAAEILDRATQPKKLSSIVALLADRPLRNRLSQRPTTGGGHHDAPPAGHPANGGFNSSDDDIPF